MRTLLRLTLVTLIAITSVTAGLLFNRDTAPRTAEAQDDASMGITCDSTLILLLLLAEHEYDYISGMDEMMMSEMPTFDYGQYTYLIQDTVAMMTAMMDEMSDEEMAAAEATNMMVEEMMGMDAAGILAGYDAAMGYEAMGDMTVLAPGNVAGEPAECTSLRASLEQFIVAHLVADVEMMMEQ